MSENAVDVRVNAVISELTAQRNQALDRSTSAVGEIAVLRAKVAELEAQLKPKEPTA